MTGRDRRLDELATIEFVGSLGEAFGHYAAAVRAVASRWDTELGLASTDVHAALVSVRWGWLSRDAAKARRVARRLRRAQTLVAALTRCAERFPREYAKQFMTPDAAKQKTGGGGGS